MKNFRSGMNNFGSGMNNFGSGMNKFGSGMNKIFLIFSNFGIEDKGRTHIVSWGITRVPSGEYSHCKSAIEGQCNDYCRIETPAIRHVRFGLIR